MSDHVDVPYVQVQPVRVFLIRAYCLFFQLNAWIDSLVTKYPTLCKTSSIGKSYEGRDIRMLSVS